MLRVVTVRVQGGLPMLFQWLKRREVFRAYATHGQDRMTIFRPFLTKPYVSIPRRSQFGHLEADPRAFMTALLEGSDDDFDLFAHEVGWHLIENQRDGPGINGIGSNDLLRRAKTTTAAERAHYVEFIAAAVGALRFEGI